jgi:hypothetical protein
MGALVAVAPMGGGVLVRVWVEMAKARQEGRAMPVLWRG